MMYGIMAQERIRFKAEKGAGPDRNVGECSEQEPFLLYQAAGTGVRCIEFAFPCSRQYERSIRLQKLKANADFAKRYAKGNVCLLMSIYNGPKKDIMRLPGNIYGNPQFSRRKMNGSDGRCAVKRKI